MVLNFSSRDMDILGGTSKEPLLCDELDITLCVELSIDSTTKNRVNIICMS